MVIAGVVASSHCPTQLGREEEGRHASGRKAAPKHCKTLSGCSCTLYLTELSPNHHRRGLVSPQPFTLCLSQWFPEVLLCGQAAELSGTFGDVVLEAGPHLYSSERAGSEPSGTGGDQCRDSLLLLRSSGWRPGQRGCGFLHSPPSSAYGPGRRKALFVPVYRGDRSARVFPMT